MMETEGIEAALEEYFLLMCRRLNRASRAGFRWTSKVRIEAL